MFLIKRTKRGKSHYVTKIDPVKGFILGTTALAKDAPTFSEADAKLFASFYEQAADPNIGDFEIFDTAKKKVVHEIEAPEPPVDPIAEQMAANREQFKAAIEDTRGSTNPSGSVLVVPESKGVVVTTGKADTKGHPSAKDLAGTDKK